MTLGGIYKIQNIANGKRYIGSASNFSRRWVQHRWHLRRGRHHSCKLQRAWNKYGEHAFAFVPMLLCNNAEDLYAHEQIALDGLKPEYNIAQCAESSMRGRKHTEEFRKRMLGNKYSLGYKHPPEFGAAIVVRNKGRKFSAESVAKSVLARTGLKRSLESRERMRLAQLGKKRTFESIAKQAATQRGKVWGPAFCAAVSAGKRAAIARRAEVSRG